MTLSDFLSWLDSYLNFEKTQTKNIFWLDSMRFLCGKLGNPQDKIPCIHIAGSKGKGSASEMIANILEESGKKCGIYTSPHITDFRERISSPKGFFPDRIYEKSAEKLVSLVDSIPLSDLPGKRPLTWFELVTVFAFLCFEEAGCDFAVYEVGLGGRLDSTNVVKPLLSVIMPIELEHTDFLGGTIEKIAEEKAGIIKENVPCVIARQNFSEAEKVFIEKSREKKSEIIFTKENSRNPEYGFKNGKMNVRFEVSGRKIKAEMNLLGKVQAENAETSALAVLKLFPGIKTHQIEKGLSKAFLPGRFEVFRSGKKCPGKISFPKREIIVLDGAHTVKSVENTIRTMKEVFPERKYILLFSIAGGKDAKDIVPLFKGVFRKIIFTEGKTVRNASSGNLLEIAGRSSVEAENIPEVKNALERVKNLCGKSDIILVEGSFYLVSEIKEILESGFHKKHSEKKTIRI